MIAKIANFILSGIRIISLILSLVCGTIFIMTEFIIATFMIFHHSFMLQRAINVLVGAPMFGIILYGVYYIMCKIEIRECTDDR